MNRKVSLSLMSALMSVIVILGFASPVSAADKDMVTSNSVVANITKIAGLSQLPNPPSLDNLYFVPEINEANPVQLKNFTVWANAAPGVSYAARRVVGGTQQFIDIANTSAPTMFKFDVKNGFYVKPGPNGSALIYSSGNRVVGISPRPWANDARGKFIPAHFAFSQDGKSLTKIVEHRQAGTVYPVVADPIVIWLLLAGAWVLDKCFVNGTKEAQSLKGQKWYIVLWNVGWVCVSNV